MSRSSRTSRAAVATRTASRDGDIPNGEVITRAFEEAEENVFLFVPNLIGYARIVLAALSLSYMDNHPKVCTVLYGISCLLDAFDGMAARALGQSTKFGAVLDMVTDRCTTSCLLCFLSIAYPRYAILFQALITLDFSSHYIHMYTSLTMGSASHKIVTSDVSRILWYYYNDSRTLFVFCAGNELFFVCLYLMNFYKKPLELNPNTIFGQAIVSEALKHPGSYLNALVRYVPTATWPQLVGAVTFPICFVKQLINCVQFWKAAQMLVGIDLVARKKQKQRQQQ